MTRYGVERIQDVYECGAYKRSMTRAEPVCSSHYVSTAAVRELLLLTLRTVCPWAIQNKEAFAARVREESELRHKSAAREAKRQMTAMQKRHAELDVLIQKQDTAEAGRA